VNKSRAFLKFVSSLSPAELRFTEHFAHRSAVRGISETMIHDFVFNRSQDLLYVDEETSPKGLKRFKAVYSLGKKKAVFVVADVEANGSLTIVTSIIVDKRLQLAAIKNARRYAKLADRLR